MIGEVVGVDSLIKILIDILKPEKGAKQWKITNAHGFLLQPGLALLLLSVY